MCDGRLLWLAMASTPTNRGAEVLWIENVLGPRFVGHTTHVERPLLSTPIDRFGPSCHPTEVEAER